jgi:hypothetical protein
MIPLKSLMGAPLDDLLGARLFWQDWRRWEPYVVPQLARFVRIPDDGDQ